MLSSINHAGDRLSPLDYLRSFQIAHALFDDDDIIILTATRSVDKKERRAKKHEKPEITAWSLNRTVRLEVVSSSESSFCGLRLML